MQVTCRSLPAAITALSALLAPAFLAARAEAQDISGRVVDKLLKPVAEARVCVQGGGPCAVSGADGTFRLRPGSAARDPSFLSLGFRLERGPEGLVLRAPRPVSALVAWSDASGRALGPERSLSLDTRGVPVPGPEGATAAAAGLVFLRMRSEGISATWKCLWGPGSAEPAVSGKSSGGAAPLPYALSKAAAPPALEAAKAGYGRRTYMPLAETETGVEIMLPAEGEVALFDGRSLDGWKGTAGWWKVVDGAIRGKGTSSGLLVTDGNYGEFRLFLRSRNVNGKSHMGICFWGKRDPNFKYGECTLVMPHDGGQWDYHAGEGGVPHQSPPPKASGPQIPDQGRFYYTEILASRSRKTIKMETEGVFMIDHRNKEGLTLWDGPIGLQIHDGSIELEHKDIFVEVDPKQPDRLLYLK